MNASFLVSLLALAMAALCLIGFFGTAGTDHSEFSRERQNAGVLESQRELIEGYKAVLLTLGRLERELARLKEAVQASKTAIAVSPDEPATSEGSPLEASADEARASEPAASARSLEAHTEHVNREWEKLLELPQEERVLRVMNSPELFTAVLENSKIVWISQLEQVLGPRQSELQGERNFIHFAPTGAGGALFVEVTGRGQILGMRAQK